MKFIDQLYELYKNQLTADEEDVVIVISGVLSELNSEEMMELIKDMEQEEIFQMLGSYLVDQLRVKLVEKGAAVPDETISSDGLIH